VKQIIRFKTIDITIAKIFFKKIIKNLNNKNFIITEQKRKIEVLETRVVQLEPRKRRKVKISPISKFANIEKIYKT
jgi:hypothetical protein